MQTRIFLFLDSTFQFCSCVPGKREARRDIRRSNWRGSNIQGTFVTLMRHFRTRVENKCAWPPRSENAVFQTTTTPTFSCRVNSLPRGSTVFQHHLLAHTLENEFGFDFVRMGVEDDLQT